MDKGAVISEDQLYRYQLTRRWGTGGSVCFVGLNPSTADANIDDPTIRRCIGFARAWGYDAIEMLNLFALRATDPKDMRSHADPVGTDNDAWLVGARERNEIVIACWGANGSHLRRDLAVLEMLDDVYCLGVTKAGLPKHPLYLAKNTPLRLL